MSEVWRNLQISPSFATLGEPFSVPVLPEPLHEASLLALNTELLAEFGIVDTEAVRESITALFSGREAFDDFPPRAAVYSGHQFGVYVPQLGDGRALLYAEVLDKHGQRQQWQLKGGGKTPFSRMGDGRAVLRSTIREYLCSEAMHHLGIPTTRALCLLRSKEPVYRETPETGATMVRVSPTFLRFGSFQFFAHTGQHDALKTLLDFTIREHFADYQDEPDAGIRLFADVVKRTADLIAQWQAFGFAHGVMNTDNMSILGLTIDYGPFGFLDAFEPHFICNHSDYHGRYAFDEQPTIAYWNLCRFAESLLPLLSKEALGAELEKFELRIIDSYSTLMRKKLGLATEQNDDRALSASLQKLMADNAADYTRSFRALSHLQQAPHDSDRKFLDEFADRDAASQWLALWRQRLQRESNSNETRQQQMLAVNPKYILRNYLAQQAIAAAEQGDDEPFHRLYQLLRHPFDEQAENEHYADLPPDWGRHLEISCSS